MMARTPWEREQQRLRHLLDTVATDSEYTVREQELEETCNQEATNKLMENESYYFGKD
ncbi:hypothetical protein TNCV_2520791, partial [Trichonephila clavipes]